MTAKPELDFWMWETLCTWLRRHGAEATTTELLAMVPSEHLAAALGQGSQQSRATRMGRALHRLIRQELVLEDGSWSLGRRLVRGRVLYRLRRWQGQSSAAALRPAGAPVTPGRCPSCGTAYHEPIETRRALQEAHAEVERLTGWLRLIDGGDRPCDDATELRRMAYDALTLGKEAPRD